jgi:hypothetical protein
MVFVAVPSNCPGSMLLSKLVRLLYTITPPFHLNLLASNLSKFGYFRPFRP